MLITYDATIIGGGFSGTCTLLNILRFAKKPLKLALLERKPAFLGTGLAYNSTVIDPVHILNRHPSAMSIFVDEPEHFINWLGSVDKTNWPPAYQLLNKNSYSVPRPVFGLYLKDSLRKELAQSRSNIKIITEAAISAVPRGGNVVLGLGSGNKLKTRQLVLATGNVLVKKMPFTKNIENDSRYIADRWSVEAKGKVAAIPQNGEVLILGTGAAMFDTLCNLNTQNHKGKIVALSRNGNVNGFYREGYLPEKANIPIPLFTEVELQDAEVFARRIINEYQKAEAALPDDGRLKSEEIMLAWEAAIPAIVSRMPEAVVKTLLDRYGSLLATMRLGLLPETVRHYTALSERGQIELIAGNIISMAPAEDGIAVTYKSNGNEVSKVFSSVINCMGQELDYTKIAASEPLWGSLISNQALTAPHPMGYGITVGTRGELKTASGVLTPQIITVGPMRGADTTLTHGKLGLLAQSVETLRNQAYDAAIYTLDKINKIGEPDLSWAL